MKAARGLSRTDISIHTWATSHTWATEAAMKCASSYPKEEGGLDPRSGTGSCQLQVVSGWWLQMVIIGEADGEAGRRRRKAECERI